MGYSPLISQHYFCGWVMGVSTALFLIWKVPVLTYLPGLGEVCGRIIAHAVQILRRLIDYIVAPSKYFT